MLVSSRLIVDVSTHHLRMRENRNNYSSIIKFSILEIGSVEFGRKLILQWQINTVGPYFYGHSNERHLVYKVRGSVIKLSIFFERSPFFYDQLAIRGSFYRRVRKSNWEVDTDVLCVLRRSGLLCLVLCTVHSGAALLPYLVVILLQ